MKLRNLILVSSVELYEAAFVGLFGSDFTG